MSRKNNQVELIQSNTKEERKIILKINWGRNFFFPIVWVDSPFCPYFVHLASPGGTRRSPPGSQHWTELVVPREEVRLGAKCGASQQCSLPLSSFWENTSSLLLLFLDTFVFIFLNCISTKELFIEGIFQIQQ